MKYTAREILNFVLGKPIKENDMAGRSEYQKKELQAALTESERVVAQQKCVIQDLTKELEQQTQVTAAVQFDLRYEKRRTEQCRREIESLRSRPTVPLSTTRIEELERQNIVLRTERDNAKFERDEAKGQVAIWKEGLLHGNLLVGGQKVEYVSTIKLQEAQTAHGQTALRMQVVIDQERSLKEQALDQARIFRQRAESAERDLERARLGALGEAQRHSMAHQQLDRLRNLLAAREAIKQPSVIYISGTEELRAENDRLLRKLDNIRTRLDAP